MKLAELNIDQIVNAVLKQIQHGASASSINPVSPKQPSSPTGPIQISGRIITADLLSQKTTASASVQFESKAIITPAARDYIKEQRILVSSTSVTSQAANSSPAQTSSSWLSLGVHSSESLESAAASVIRDSGDIWEQQFVDSTETAAQQAVMEIKSENKTGVVIFTDQPATAACLVNRNEIIRGVAVRRPNDTSDIAELNANVICIPGRGLSFTEYRNLLKYILSR
ncbi:MAG: hypothetical protein JKY95_14765 [Planctomycetaceae bacterium]|nr:hypothetical protein [Planctomycetaceae bacterium]